MRERLAGKPDAGNPPVRFDGGRESGGHWARSPLNPPTPAYPTAEREIAHLRETASDLHRICADPAEVRRHFAVVALYEIAQNEFNLNLPRYVDTFEAEEVLPLDLAMERLGEASKQSQAEFFQLEQVVAGLPSRP